MQIPVRKYQHILAGFVSLCLLQSLAVAQNAGELITARHGMVVSASAEASRVGAAILASGGNAVDAAVAVGFALAVTYPSAGNLGGGAYIIIRMADGRTSAIDARETAPAAATRDMYLDESGEVIEGLSLKGPLAAGVPGSVDGLLTALKKYGTISRQQAIAPAIQLAREGFPLHERAANLFGMYKTDFAGFPSSFKMFFKPDGGDYRAGEIWAQPDLAATLERISDEGRDGFYRGVTADLICAQMQSGGGIITHADLENYASIEREPVSGTYNGYKVLSMPPSSSGGVVLLEMLNMLKGFPLSAYGKYTFETAHLMVEVMKRAFADRAAYLGDPAFHTIPVEQLLSDEYAKKLISGMHPARATASSEIRPGLDNVKEGTHTTHYSVVDSRGNAVSVTTTLNSTFGGKCAVDGAGFLLNNEMDDFSIKPDVPNQFGLVGNNVNAIAPGKRMLSSMTPVIVHRDGRSVLITGSPGGATIITTVLQVFLNAITFNMPIDAAIRAPRFHHQWKPDEVIYEEGAFDADQMEALKRAGHILRLVPSFGRAEGIVIDEAGIHGCSDPRGYGAAIGH